MTAVERAILAALAVGDRSAARVLLGRRIQDREAHTLPTDTNTERN